MSTEPLRFADYSRCPEVVLQVGTLEFHRHGLTGAGPQDVVDGLIALELAFQRGGCGPGWKRNPLALDRSLGDPTSSLEADGEEASDNGGEWSAHRIALGWSFINLARFFLRNVICGKSRKANLTALALQDGFPYPSKQGIPRAATKTQVHRVRAKKSDILIRCIGQRNFKGCCDHVSEPARVKHHLAKTSQNVFLGFPVFVLPKRWRMTLIDT